MLISANTKILDGRMSEIEAVKYFAKCGFNALDLGMGDIWIDDHKIVCVYRIKLILNKELPFAAQNIKKFHVVMGMGDRMPISAVHGTGSIQQFGGSANGERMGFIQRVIASAHKNLLKIPEF